MQRVYINKTYPRTKRQRQNTSYHGQEKKIRCLVYHIESAIMNTKVGLVKTMMPLCGF